jgi:hypothetical protein
VGGQSIATSAPNFARGSSEIRLQSATAYNAGSRLKVRTPKSRRAPGPDVCKPQIPNRQPLRFALSQEPPREKP